MSVTPRQLLEKFSQSATLLPGLPEHEIAQFQQQLRCPVPEEIRQTLSFSAGFNSNTFGAVRFTGHQDFELTDLFPQSVALLPDGCGNFWVVDINPKNGTWGLVFYACHDPAVIVLQARDLVTFISQVLDAENTEPRDALRYVRGEAVKIIWRDDPWLVPVRDARVSQDSVVSQFAEHLPEGFGVADLRPAGFGSGFSWGKAGPNAEVRRHGAELVFGIQQRVPSFLRKIFATRRS
ncbi:MAG TPA: SMI1/KNR4 family protein [Candidatus Acidoferrum sp.]|nr:SMI1/KNR4 family protein [Candidatus Acidoferrum sp.]